MMDLDDWTFISVAGLNVEYEDGAVVLNNLANGDGFALFELGQSGNLELSVSLDDNEQCIFDYSFDKCRTWSTDRVLVTKDIIGRQSGDFYVASGEYNSLLMRLTIDVNGPYDFCYFYGLELNELV